MLKPTVTQNIVNPVDANLPPPQPLAHFDYLEYACARGRAITALAGHRDHETHCIQLDLGDREGIGMIATLRPNADDEVPNARLLWAAPARARKSKHQALIRLPEGGPMVLMRLQGGGGWELYTVDGGEVKALRRSGDAWKPESLADYAAQ